MPVTLQISNVRNQEGTNMDKCDWCEKDAKWTSSKDGISCDNHRRH